MVDITGTGAKIALKELFLRVILCLAIDFLEYVFN